MSPSRSYHDILLNGTPTAVTVLSGSPNRPALICTSLRVLAWQIKRLATPYTKLAEGKGECEDDVAAFHSIHCFGSMLLAKSQHVSSLRLTHSAGAERGYDWALRRVLRDSDVPANFLRRVVGGGRSDYRPMKGITMEKAVALFH